LRWPRLSGVPVMKLTMAITSWPSAMNRSQRCEPRNPAAPVISTRMSVFVAESETCPGACYPERGAPFPAGAQDPRPAVAGGRWSCARARRMPERRGAGRGASPGVRRQQPFDEPWDARFDRDARAVAEQPGGLGDVGAGAQHIAGLSGSGLDPRFDLQRIGDEVDEAADGRGAALAEVDDLELRVHAARPFDRGDDAVEDVIDPGVIAFGRSVAEHRHRPPVQHQRGELPDGEVRALAGAVDGEETQGDDAHAVE